MAGIGQVLLTQFLQSQAMRKEQARRDKEALRTEAFNRGAKLAELGDTTGLTLIGKHLDPDIHQTFVSQAEQVKEQQIADFVNQVQGRLMASGGPTGEFMPQIDPATGETKGLITPSGGAVVSGQPGVMPMVKRKGGGEGKTEFLTRISESGKTSFQEQRVPAATREFEGKEIYRRAQLSLEDVLVNDYGMDPVTARAQSSFLARQMEGAIPTEEGIQQAELAQFPTEGGAQAPRGMSSRQMGKFFDTTAARAGEMANSRDLERADRESFNSAGEALRGLARLRRLYIQVEERAGPAKGRYATFEDWAGYGSPEVREFTRVRKGIADNLRRKITGAAAGFQEIGNIEARVPGLKDSPENFEAGLSAAVNEINDTLIVVKKNLEAQRFLVPGVLTDVPEGLRNYLESVDIPEESIPKPSKADREWAENFVKEMKKELRRR